MCVCAPIRESDKLGEGVGAFWAPDEGRVSELLVGDLGFEEESGSGLEGWTL